MAGVKNPSHQRQRWSQTLRCAVRLAYHPRRTMAHQIARRTTLPPIRTGGVTAAVTNAALWRCVLARMGGLTAWGESPDSHPERDGPIFLSLAVTGLTVIQPTACQCRGFLLIRFPMLIKQKHNTKSVFCKYSALIPAFLLGIDLMRRLIMGYE